jgi:hypothetical protein
LVQNSVAHKISTEQFSNRNYLPPVPQKTAPDNVDPIRQQVK